jgi:antitoxin VapB
MKTAKVLQKGHSQFIKLPKSFHLESPQVFIKQVGQTVVLIPTDHPWDSLFNSLSKFSEDFMATREQLLPQVREELFEE